MKKTYKIFVSSCRQMLEEERKILSDTILKKNNIPIQMEHQFSGTNSEYSIDIDREKIQEADCVIIILSYLYGELIGYKIPDRNNCHLRADKHENCESCQSRYGCRLSFTQYEYEYAKKIKKPIIVIFNTHYNDEKSFDEANKRYEKQYGTDSKSLFYTCKEKNVNFVTDATRTHGIPYSNYEEFLKACEKAVDSAVEAIKEDEQNGLAKGLVSHEDILKAEEEVKVITAQLKHIMENGIETIYDSQSSAINALVQEGNPYIYYGPDNKVQDIKVLAIRGSSFAGGMGHEWTRLILDAEFKPDEEVYVEFVLSNCENEKLIEERYTAFYLKQATTPKNLQAYKNEYKNDMIRVQERIRDYRRDHPCKLFLHNEARLPFRMVFIGKYLFLSTFLNTVKAADAPVIKIPYTSSLYKVCKEYYEWIKKNAVEDI